MLAFIRPICESKFYVFKNYKLSYFDDSPESKHYLNKEIITPTIKHREIYSSVYGKQRAENLNGVLARISVAAEDISSLLMQEDFKLYNPLEDTPELFTELAKVDPFNEKSLLKFINEYGIPSFGELDPNYLIDNSQILIDRIDTILFAKELSDYKTLFNLWNAITENDVSVLDKVKEDFESEAKELQNDNKRYLYEISANQSISEQVIKEMEVALEKNDNEFNNFDAFVRQYHDKIDNRVAQEFTFNNSVWTKWIEIKNKPLKVIAKHFLVYKLNKYKSGKSSFVIKDEEILPGITFNSLIEVAYHQLSQAIVNNIELRECLNCGALFEVIHEGRKFCPPLPGRKRSTCENTYNQRLKRQRARKKGEK